MAKLGQQTHPLFTYVFSSIDRVAGPLSSDLSLLLLLTQAVDCVWRVCRRKTTMGGDAAVHLTSRAVKEGEWGQVFEASSM